MPAVSRLGDVCTGHGQCGPRPSTSASPNVFVNGIPVHRQADGWAKHCQHTSILATGAPHVFVNGLEIARIGDPVACGSKVAIGSPNVFAGNKGGAATASPEMEAVLPSANIAPGVNPVDALVQIVAEDTTATPAEVAAFSSMGVSSNYSFPPAIDALPPLAVENTPPVDSTEVPSDCSDIFETTTFTGGFQLTPNFQLKDLTTNCAVSNYALRSQLGLTEQQIVCSMRKLCLNLLEPITAQFGRPSITSGFRHGSNTSWHNKGSATDIQFSGYTDQQYYNAIVWIKDNLAWSELILEYGGNRPWLHVAYNSTSVSLTNFKTRVTVANGYKSGFYNLINVPQRGGIGVG